MAKKEQWQIDHDKRVKAEKAGMDALTPRQLEAITKASKALSSFVCEWSDGFDLYNCETPRELSAAFWMIQNHFHLDDES